MPALEAVSHSDDENMKEANRDAHGLPFSRPPSRLAAKHSRRFSLTMAQLARGHEGAGARRTTPLHRLAERLGGIASCRHVICFCVGKDQPREKEVVVVCGNALMSIDGRRRKKGQDEIFDGRYQ